MTALPLDPGALAGLRQPDRRTCGPACLVAARMLLDPAYALSVRRLGWDAEVLATHRRVTGTVAADGDLQPPWPRALGTPPWALARELSTYDAPRRVLLARLDPARHLPEVHRTCAVGRVVPLYVGDRWLPRHVVLVVGQHDDRLRVYEPARGVLTVVTDEQVARRRLALAGWNVPWFVVVPGGDQPGHPARAGSTDVRIKRLP